METLLNVPCLLTIWWWVRRCFFLYSVRSTRKLGFAALVQWQEGDGCCKVPLTQVYSLYYTMLMYTICDHPVNTVHPWKITFQLNRGLIKLWWWNTMQPSKSQLLDFWALHVMWENPYICLAVWSSGKLPACPENVTFLPILDIKSDAGTGLKLRG